MTSNGPASCRRSLYSLVRVIAAASTSSGVRSTWTARNPSRASPRRPRRSWPRWRRSTCGPKSRSGRVLLRSAHSFSGRSSTIATGSTSCSRASRTSGRRASGWALVASITVSRPEASRLPAMNWSTSNASGVADWSFSSSATRPRQTSEEITSVGLKCARANVDLPEPVTPISTTRLSSGMASSRVTGSVTGSPLSRRRPAGWAGRRAGPRGRRAGTWPGTRSRRRPRRPRRGTAPWSTRSGGPGAVRYRVGASRSARCTRRWAW